MSQSTPQTPVSLVGAPALERHATLLLYLQTFGLILFTFLLGRAGVAPVRYVFIAGCVGIGYQSWRVGPGRHLEISVILFVMAPFLRRVVDFSAGFDPSGYMLVGPLLGLAPVCVDLYGWLVKGKIRSDPRVLLAYGVMAIGPLYAATISILSGQILQMLVGSVKLFMPALYGLWLAARAGEDRNVVDAAARGFMIAMPLAGLYAIYQYFYLPDWDSYWMVMTAAISNSQGLPEAEKVRVFSTMNSAASFGHFAAAGLLLLGFAVRSRLSLLLCVPVIVGLMLSLYRTAWLGLAASLVYCILNSVTRGRAALVAVWLIAGAVAVMTTTSFGDVIADRVSTFGSAPSGDESGQARLGQFAALFDNADQLWFGYGLSGQSTSETGEAPRVKLTDAVDGIVISTVLQMGILGSAIYLTGLVWVISQGLLRVAQAPELGQVVAGAIVVGNLLAFPLTNGAVGEIGFLFWSFLGIATSQPVDFKNGGQRAMARTMR